MLAFQSRLKEEKKFSKKSAEKGEVVFETVEGMMAAIPSPNLHFLSDFQEAFCTLIIKILYSCLGA